ncbi:hypothetical protein [Kitasatospora purpeofusca]|uniref:hypothetical protein n=1 Tax=Kitasatospora purpeofusca TaxID=67352 RepID=UPI00367ABB8B
MTDPRQAVATERGRYYEDPSGGPPLISVTNVLDHSVNKPILIPWATKVVTNYVFEQLPRITTAARTGPEEIIKEIKKQPELAREAAADRGSRVHKRAEAHLLGQPTPVEEDTEVLPYFRQFLKWVAEWDLDPAKDLVAAEVTVANRALGYAGTLDMLIQLPTGRTPRTRRQLWLVDIKTSATQPSTRIWSEYPLQLAAYRYAPTIWTPDGSDAPMPRVHGAAILNLRQRRHNLIPVPANRRAFRAFRSALVVAQHLQEAETTKYIPLKPPTRDDAEPLRRAA